LNFRRTEERERERRTMYSKKRTSSGPKNDSSDELDIGTARQVKSWFLVSTFAGVAPDLVCHGFPLQSVQYPLVPA